MCVWGGGVVGVLLGESVEKLNIDICQRCFWRSQNKDTCVCGEQSILTWMYLFV